MQLVRDVSLTCGPYNFFGCSMLCFTPKAPNDKSLVLEDDLMWGTWNKLYHSPISSS
jgi:hypothetical protein